MPVTSKNLGFLGVEITVVPDADYVYDQCIDVVTRGHLIIRRERQGRFAVSDEMDFYAIENDGTGHWASELHPEKVFLRSKMKDDNLTFKRINKVFQVTLPTHFEAHQKTKKEMN